MNDIVKIIKDRYDTVVKFSTTPEQDAMIPFRNSADYLAALPHARLQALPGVGHLPQEEAPQTVAILRAFLDE